MRRTLLVTALALLASTARAEEPRLVVALMPFAGEGDVGSKERDGVFALTRAALETHGAVRLISTRKDDVVTARTCRDDDCWRDAARARGVDFIAHVTLSGTDQGYLAKIHVVSIDASVAARDETFDVDGAALERDALRLGLRAFAPDALRGRLVVTGSPEGALVLVDGERKGKLPLEGPIDDVAEGERKVELRAKGYESITRPVDVVHGETATVDVVLSKARADLDVPVTADEREPSVLVTTLSIVPWVLLAGGAAFLVAGVACGVFALVDQMEVERRAAAGHLFFPRDALLVRRGFALSIAANVLYGVAAITLVGAGGAFGASLVVGGGEE